MRKVLHILISVTLLAATLCGCGGKEIPEVDLNDVKLEEWPLTDCSTSTRPVRDLMKVNILYIDGVAPGKESLRDNKYPFVSSIYAAVRKTESHESMAYKLFQFLFTKKGADMIDESGYIAIRK